MSLRVRVRKRPPRYHNHLAANFGSLRCANCGELLNEREIIAAYKKRIVAPTCFACQGGRREKTVIDIDGPEGQKR